MYIYRSVSITPRLSLSDLIKQAKEIALEEGAKPEDCYFEVMLGTAELIVPCVTKQSQTNLENCPNHESSPA